MFFVGWITHVHERCFIGFGPHLECQHCHNGGWQEIWQPFSQLWAYSLVPTHPKVYGDFSVVCRICKWGTTVKKKKKAKIAELLEQGKQETKYRYEKLGKSGKYFLLKQLKRNGFTRVSSYIAADKQALHAGSRRPPSPTRV